jgi:hypothetical protein
MRTVPPTLRRRYAMCHTDARLNLCAHIAILFFRMHAPLVARMTPLIPERYFDARRITVVGAGITGNSYALETQRESGQPIDY